MGRLLLRQGDSIQRPLGPLDVHDQLADGLTAQSAIELVSLEERERGEHSLLHGQHPLALARLSLGAEAGGHEVEQRESCSGQDREGHEDLEERNAAASQSVLP